MISVSNLHKSFGMVKAVDNLSFDISKGEIVGFLGPNGAGKTTTMRLLTGYLTPDEGKIVINGVPVNEDLSSAQKQIGYLPENNPLYTYMLVSEMFELSADLKQIPKSERKEAFDFAVGAVSIENVYYRPIGELSKGYKQRVGMALALMHKPKIIVMDEPTEGLDPNQRTDIRNLIKDLSKDRTIILSTHVMQEAVALSNRIFIINQGQMVADGTPEELTQTSKDMATVTAQIEGNNLLKDLKAIKNFSKVEGEKIGPKKYSITIQAPKKVSIQKEISQLISQKKWVIWSLQEHQTNLEDVFQELTQSKHETK